MSGDQVIIAILTLVSSSSLAVALLSIGPQRRKIAAEAQGSQVSSAALLTERALAMVESQREQLAASEASRLAAIAAAEMAMATARQYQARVYTFEADYLRRGLPLPPEERTT